MIAVIDCLTSGFTCEKFIGALVDLGVDPQKLQEIVDIVSKCTGSKLNILVKDVKRGEIRCKYFHIESSSSTYMNSKELQNVMMNCLRSIQLPEKAIDFIRRVQHTILLAESKVHGEDIEKLRLYEISSPSAIAQLICVATSLNELKLFNETLIYSTPVSVGGGMIKTSHGIISVPAFSTLEILKLKKFPFIGGPSMGELTTPLGASVLVNLAKPVKFYPLMTALNVGYGAGNEDFSEFPNIVRVVIGYEFKGRVWI